MGLDPLHQHAVKRARAKDLSAWLSVMPIEKNNCDLIAQEFRDVLAVWYREPLLCIPPHCDGCHAPSSLDHFLICRKGGLIVQWYNKIRDAIGDPAALSRNLLYLKMVMMGLLSLILVFVVYGHHCLRCCLISVSQTLMPSLTLAPEFILFQAETKKKQKYAAATSACRAHFTPLCFSVDGLAGSETACFIKRLATGLSSK